MSTTPGADARTPDADMVNLAGPRALDDSIESMNLGFSLQARCREAIAGGSVGADSGVVPVPRTIEERVAAAHVALAGGRTSAIRVEA